MNAVLKIAGIVGYLIVIYSVLAAITVVVPAFNVARLHLEDKLKNEPLSVSQRGAVRESLDLAKRLGDEDAIRKTSLMHVTQVGLVLISTVCLIAGLRAPKKNGEPARHRTTPLITPDSHMMLPFNMASRFQRFVGSLGGRA